MTKKHYIFNNENSSKYLKRLEASRYIDSMFKAEKAKPISSLIA